MQVVVLKYVQVLCITVFVSNNINCDQLLLHNKDEDPNLYRIGSCAAECLVEGNTHTSLELCHRLCSEGTAERRSDLVRNTELTFNIRLICRDSTSLVIEIYQSEQQNTRKSNAFPFNAIHQSDSKNSDNQRHKETNHNNVRRRKRSIARADLNRFDDSSGNRSDINSSSHDNDTGPRHKSSHAKQTRFVYLIKVQESGKKMGDRTVYMAHLGFHKSGIHVEKGHWLPVETGISSITHTLIVRCLLLRSTAIPSTKQTADDKE